MKLLNLVCKLGQYSIKAEVAIDKHIDKATKGLKRLVSEEDYLSNIDGATRFVCEWIKYDRLSDSHQLRLALAAFIREHREGAEEFLPTEADTIDDLWELAIDTTIDHFSDISNS